MEIHYKGITNERMEDAPFVGALICAVGCNFNCKGCFNQNMKDSPTLIKTAEEIVTEIKLNPFNKGIIFGGLEWSLQPLELLELAAVASENDLQVMIYTGLGLRKFQMLIGSCAAKEHGYLTKIDEINLTKEDDGIFAFIGAMILDTIINKEYYIKCGLYDENDLAEDRVHFGIKLASNNQTIYKFVTDVEDKHYGQTEDGTDHLNIRTLIKAKDKKGKKSKDKINKSKRKTS